MITARESERSIFALSCFCLFTVQCSPSVIYADADADAGATATVAITAQFVRIHIVKCEYKRICAISLTYIHLHSHTHMAGMLWCFIW